MIVVRRVSRQRREFSFRSRRVSGISEISAQLSGMNDLGPVSTSTTACPASKISLSHGRWVGVADRAYNFK